MKEQVNHIDMEEQSPDYAQSEYTTPYHITNDQGKALIKCLKPQPRYTTCTTQPQNTLDHCG